MSGYGQGVRREEGVKDGGRKLKHAKRKQQAKRAALAMGMEEKDQKSVL